MKTLISHPVNHERGEEAIDYKTHLKLIQVMFLAMAIVSNSKTHAMRESGARSAESKGKI